MTDPERRLFLSYSSYLKNKYGGRVYRIAVDGGFSCPNREISGAGCTYCDEYGSMAPYLTGGSRAGCPPADTIAGRNFVPVREQIMKALSFIKERYKAENFILYFQAFSGTYAGTGTLKRIYDEALEFHPFKELIVSTRPDCIDENVADLLASYKTSLSDVWVELGLQSAHNRTLARINRGHDYRHFHEAFLMLKSKGIKCAVHVIFGLPGESGPDIMATVDRLAELRPDGIKIHDLHIPAGTDIHREFLWGELSLPSGRRHLSYVMEALQRLPRECVIMRLTCDTPADRRVMPQEVQGKETFLRTLRNAMRAENIWQGKYFEQRSNLRKECTKMVISDSDVINALKKIGEHFRKNISNKYMRKTFTSLQIDMHAWELIDDLTKETTFFGDYRFDELYERILAVAEFVGKAKRQLMPNIRSLVITGSDSMYSRSGGLTANEKLLREIAVSNFPANMAILADMVNDLYVKVVNYDTQTNGPESAAYKRMPELERIGQLLV